MTEISDIENLREYSQEPEIGSPEFDLASTLWDDLQRYLSAIGPVSEQTCEFLRRWCHIVAKEIVKEHIEDTHGFDYKEALVRVLHLITDKAIDPAHPGFHRMHGYIAMMMLGACRYSEVDVARMCGVTKAAVSKAKIEWQDELGIIPRIGRSQCARDTFSTKATAAAPKIRKLKCKLYQLWSSRLPSLSLV